MTRILTNQQTTITLTTYNTSGTQTDLGTFTIGITDGNGDTITSSGTAVTDNNDGTYDYTLSAQPNVNLLTATWTEDSGQPIYTTHTEIVGGFLFDENQARNWGVKDDSNNIPLNSESEYSDTRIAEERNRITDELEQWTGRSWIPRYCRIEASGTGTPELPLVDGIPRLSTGLRLHRPGRLRDVSQLLSVTVDGATVSTSDVQIDSDRALLIRDSGNWNRPQQSNRHNVTVEYEYGLPYLLDGVDRIALDLLLDRLVPSAYPRSALSVDSEFGTVRFVTEGGTQKNVSRLPHVNQWVRDHDHRMPF